MTKKDYVRLAAILALARKGVESPRQGTAPADGSIVIETVETEILDWLQEDNPWFDAERFRKASRVTS